MTAAANDLNLSKGSISYQINKLEENLGFALFERNKARLQLTENGRRSGMLSTGFAKLIKKLKIFAAHIQRTLHWCTDLFFFALALTSAYGFF